MRKILKSADDIFVESDIEFSEGSTSYSAITTKKTAEKVKEMLIDEYREVEPDDTALEEFWFNFNTKEIGLGLIKLTISTHRED